jgi:response regulator RpfG family c-di-GMP phosphodiesterase
MEIYSPNQKILYVDDEASLLSSFTSLMRKESVVTTTLEDSTQIESVLTASGPFAVVLTDQRMPSLDGVGVLETVARIHPATVRIMVTGFADYNDTLRAINSGGISQYITKPWKDEELKRIIQESVMRYNLRAENDYLIAALREKNNRLHELLEGTVAETSRILSDMVGYVNAHASSQVMKIRKLGLAILTTFPNLTAEEKWEIQRALELFNLGIALLPAWIQVSLTKEGLGSLKRFPVAATHYLLAAGLLKDIPRFEGVARIISMQHRNFDGTGEPEGVHCRGKEIPLGARLLHILLDLDTLSTERFRGREVLEHMRERPTRYDVELIAHMLGDYSAAASAMHDADVSVENLKPGMTLINDVLSVGGFHLFKAQTVLTATSIITLKQWHAKDPVLQPIRVRVQG